MKKRVIIIGIDGGTWDVINDFLNDLPNLKKIVKTGCHGNLMSTIPIHTACAWTSAFTGVNPGKHGVFDFFNYKDNKRIPVDSSNIKYPYIWETLSKRKKKTIALAIPFAYPAKKLNGLLVTGFGTPAIQNGFTFPPDLRAKILEKFPNYKIDPSHSFEGNAEAYRQEIFEIAEQNSEVTKELVDLAPDWDLLITVFSSPDWAQHFFWDDKKTLFKVYKIIDDFIGWLFENIYDDNTYIVLMSDHGFKKRDKLFHVNTYLKQEGYLKTKSNLLKLFFSTIGARRSLVRNLDFLGLRKFVPFGLKEAVPRAKNDSAVIDFNKSKAWSPSASGGIFVKDNNIMEELTTKLENLKDPENNQKIIRKLWKSKELYWGQYSDRVSKIYEQTPNILLFANGPYTIVDDHNKEMITKMNPSEISASHDLNGIFAAFGHDITNKKLDLVIWDIGPLALTLLDIPLYEDMDGKIKKEMFREGSELYKKDIRQIKNISSVVKFISRGRLLGKKPN